MSLPKCFHLPTSSVCLFLWNTTDGRKKKKQKTLRPCMSQSQLVHPLECRIPFPSIDFVKVGASEFSVLEDPSWRLYPRASASSR
ncbi:hypothetical protein LY78DRAFT_662106 [Colletotrichum sublineola]|nr:hypothetical protein LY78DRAFT_662106 [Colletotrichum sublineola]